MELKKLFLETLGEDALAEIGLQDCVIDESFIAHIVSPEIKTKISRAGNITQKLDGCHFYDATLEANGVVSYDLVNNHGLFKEVKIRCGNLVKKNNSTLFPEVWSKEQVIVEIAGSIRKNGKIIKNGKVIKGLGSVETEGLKILTKLTRDLDGLVTCHPVKTF